MRIGIGSDHAGVDLKKEIIYFLKKNNNIKITDFGTSSAMEKVDYPDIGKKVAQAVADNVVDRAIIICGTGIGISISANRIKGIRCALCSDSFSAILSRRHNDSNILALGGRVIGSEKAKMIVDVWLKEPFEGGRHAKRIEKLDI